MSIITKIIFNSNGQNTLARSTKILSSLSIKQFSSQDESQEYKHEEGIHFLCYINFIYIYIY